MPSLKQPIRRRVGKDKLFRALREPRSRENLRVHALEPKRSSFPPNVAVMPLTNPLPANGAARFILWYKPSERPIDIGVQHREYLAEDLCFPCAVLPPSAVPSSFMRAHGQYQRQRRDTPSFHGQNKERRLEEIRGAVWENGLRVKKI
jgi:hypothetical protein